MAGPGQATCTPPLPPLARVIPHLLWLTWDCTMWSCIAWGSHPGLTRSEREAFEDDKKLLDKERKGLIVCRHLGYVFFLKHFQWCFKYNFYFCFSCYTIGDDLYFFICISICYRLCLDFAFFFVSYLCSKI